MTYPDDEEDVEEENEDWEDPDPSDQDKNDDAEDIPCPFCRKPVSELADVCPHCGNYIARDEPILRGRPMWKIVVILLLLVFTGLIGLWRGWW
jgi:hypothetical protein